MKLQQQQNINLQIQVKANQSIICFKSYTCGIFMVTLNNQHVTISRISATTLLLEQQLTLKVCQSFDPYQIQQVYFQDEICFYVTGNPFGLYFGSKNSKNIIKVILQSLPIYSRFEALFQYPMLYVYGHINQTFQNKFININLLTFDTQLICQGKNYSPAARDKYFSVLSDQRLYVFGGTDKKGNQYESLLWTFDFHKGFWFAIKIQIPSQLYENKYYQSMIGQGKQAFILELYQSKIRKIQIQSNHQQYPELKGIFSVRQKIFFYGRKGLLSLYQLKQNKIN